MPLPGAVSKLLSSKLMKSLPRLSETSWNNGSTIALLLGSFSSIHDRPMRGESRHDDDASEDPFLRKLEPGLDKEDEMRNKTHHNHNHNPPNPIPNRPLRGLKRSDPSPSPSDDLFKLQNHHPPSQFQSRGKRDDHQSNKFDLDDRQPTPVQFLNKPMMRGENRDDQLEDSFLAKFKLGDQKRENNPHPAPITSATEEAKAPPQDADEIFKKMKETGLIPNAVAMLDGLCKDGLVQEAMKLFGLMREKGTIPEVVIYTAVVEGFCKAQKLEDAIRIFRKMQNNGITPNAFSYTIFIQGLYKGQRLEDATEFCVEMLESGHSPNVATFAGLVDGLCRDRGVEEAQSIIGRLREKGFFVDEKAVREHLDKKGPFSQLVWEAIFGKKSVLFDDPFFAGEHQESIKKTVVWLIAAQVWLFPSLLHKVPLLSGVGFGLQDSSLETTKEQASSISNLIEQATK
ncbi:hypothetical protein HHK36_008864 [Tetracentron sinense]|uniref:Pentatricopeptide repeat-containing protein n=1 Tax=Tetracentron sinense TaxID=13715 RepID=A0A835DNL6_TETSI|nr:hypothetical protein HHK36_008864 [Tetracentron sinense]